MVLNVAVHPLGVHSVFSKSQETHFTDPEAINCMYMKER